MRILLLNDTDAFAGTERHILTLAESLARASQDGVAPQPTIACPSRTPLFDRAAAAGISTVHLPAKLWPAVRGLRRLLSDESFDVVHAHNGRTCLTLALAARDESAGPARVFTQHFLRPARFDRRGVRGWVSRQIGDRATKRMHATIAISDAVARAAIDRRDVSAATVHVVLNGVNDPSADRVESAGRVAADRLYASARIGCVARLEPEKRIDVLIDAMAQLRRAGVDVACDIWGSGKLQERLELNILVSGAPVELHGHRADVLAALADVDIFVLPSDAEPFGLALVEAMALSKPVIAVDAGGPREIVVHGETGLLVPPNDPRAFAGAIESLVRDVERRTAMGRAGRERFLSHFRAERMAQDTLGVYRAVLAEQGRRA